MDYQAGESRGQRGKQRTGGSDRQAAAQAIAAGTEGCHGEPVQQVMATLGRQQPGHKIVDGITEARLPFGEKRMSAIDQVSPQWRQAVVQDIVMELQECIAVVHVVAMRQRPVKEESGI